MVVGVLQVELSVPGAESLKDKRRVVRSLKDRLHREHQVSVAEVGGQELLNLAVLGIAIAASDGRRAGEVLDAVERKIRGVFDAEVSAIDRQILDGGQIEVASTSGRDASLDAEMLERALTADGGGGAG